MISYPLLVHGTNGIFTTRFTIDIGKYTIKNDPMGYEFGMREEQHIRSL